MLDRYAWGAGPDELLLWVKGATLDCSGARVVQPNQQGSIIATADCSGNLLSINTYDEYGVPGGAEAGRFLYTGQAWFPELGLYYYKARMYSPTLGRFMQTDPIGYKDQIDLYAYVANDPVDKTDFSGLAGDDFSYLHKADQNLHQADQQLHKDSQSLHNASGIEGKAAATGAVLRDTAKVGVVTATMVGPAAASSAVKSAEHSVSKAVTAAFKSIERAFGGSGTVIRSKPTSTVVRSQDGTTQVRLDIGGHGYAPHFHVENVNPQGGKPTDATDQHHLYFKDSQ